MKHLCLSWCFVLHRCIEKYNDTAEVQVCTFTKYKKPAAVWKIAHIVRRLRATIQA